MAEANRDTPEVESESPRKGKTANENQPNIDELLEKLKGFGGGAKVFTADDIKNMDFDAMREKRRDSHDKQQKRKSNKRNVDFDVGTDETIEL